MIIEGAFYKLPEIFLASRVPEQQYESTLVSHFAMAVLLELGARSIQQPMNRIHIERPYPSYPGVKSPGRADLFVDLDGLFPPPDQNIYARYGIKASNWVEAKLFARIGSRSGSQTKVSNVGKIAVDLLRLCLLVPEETWGVGQNNRYFLSVFDRRPAEYLAFKRRSTSAPSREWLMRLLSPGENEISIRFSDEPASFHSKFSSLKKKFIQELVVSLRALTISFSPTQYKGQHSFCGYLIRILDFKIESSGVGAHYQDVSENGWDKSKSENQSVLARRILGST